MESRLKSGSIPAPITMLRARWRGGAVLHGFLGRTGGASAGPYSSLNLGQFVGDDPDSVAENFRRVRTEIGSGAGFARVNQVHGARISAVTRENAGERPRADGMVTREAGVTLAIFTADCVPILMHSERAHAVAAIHAGWRGVIAGIACEGVAAMARLGARADEISAALGPSIGACCFEVDEELADRFSREVAGAERHRRSGRAGKAYLDLRAILRGQLIAAGLAPGAIESVGPCTRCASEKFFSRRAAGGVTTGLQMSFIGLAQG